MLRVLLETIAEEDYEAFLATGTEAFQRGISKAMFTGVSRQVASRLQAGHALEYLTEIHQCEHRIFLWKLSFHDGGNQFIARLVLTVESQVAGFMLN